MALTQNKINIKTFYKQSFQQSLIIVNHLSQPAQKCQGCYTRGKFSCNATAFQVFNYTRNLLLYIYCTGQTNTGLVCKIIICCRSHNNLHISKILQEPVISFSPKFAVQVARNNGLV